MDIGSYLERIKVIDLMNNKIIAMVKDMLNEGTNRIYSISKDEAECKGRKRLATSEAVELSETRRFLLTKASSNLNEERVAYVVLDESEIRKPNSKKLKKLIKVRDLDRGFINGYRTFNAIAVSEDGRRVFLLETKPISCEEEDFQSEDLCKEELLEETSNAPKRGNQEFCIVYLLDRGFDERKIIKSIRARKDSFIIRVEYLERLVSLEREEDKLKDIAL